MIAATGGAFGSSLIPGQVGAARRLGDRIEFSVSRDGSPIGRHELQFDRIDDRVVVQIAIELKVKFGFLTFYQYEHRNREVWQGGRLIELDTETDDDGTKHRVMARARDGRLRVDGTGGQLDLPPETVTTSYWNEATIERGAWLDTQNGRLVRSAVTKLPPEPIVAGGTAVNANRYQLTGDLNLDLWYHHGQWSSLRFNAADRSTISYALQSATSDRSVE